MRALTNSGTRRDVQGAQNAVALGEDEHIAEIDNQRQRGVRKNNLVTREQQAAAQRARSESKQLDVCAKNDCAKPGYPACGQGEAVEESVGEVSFSEGDVQQATLCVQPAPSRKESGYQATARYGGLAARSNSH